MDESGQLPTLFASPGWVGLGGSLCTMEKRPLALPGIDDQLLGCPALNLCI